MDAPEVATSSAQAPVAEAIVEKAGAAVAEAPVAGVTVSMAPVATASAATASVAEASVAEAPVAGDTASAAPVATAPVATASVAEASVAEAPVAATGPALAKASAAPAVAEAAELPSWLSTLVSATARLGNPLAHRLHMALSEDTSMAAFAEPGATALPTIAFMMLLPTGLLVALMAFLRGCYPPPRRGDDFEYAEAFDWQSGFVKGMHAKTTPRRSLDIQIPRVYPLSMSWQPQMTTLPLKEQVAFMGAGTLC